MAKKSGNKLTSTNVISHDKPADIDYRAHGDCMTLESAEEIKRDKQRHGAAKKHAQQKIKSLNTICSR